MAKLRFWIGAALAVAAYSAPIRAADVAPGWGSWWLPPNHAVHGVAIDALFTWIAWITGITFILVEAVLIGFLIRYRRRTNKSKAHFTHGHTRLEMAWTIVPAIILAALALASKRVWDDYRYATPDPNRAVILVIGQQFKWNVIYPGPDGKLGRYLLFPRPTDLEWGDPNYFAKEDAIAAALKAGKPAPKFKPYLFHGVQGPAFLPYKDAIDAINQYIDTVNPLGKDFTDPLGRDDDWKDALARELDLPKGRQVEIQLSSKDVIHDFFLPNFRVKLDAVPGMRGRIFFTPQITSKERELASTRKYSIDELLAIFAQKPDAQYTAMIDQNHQTPGAEFSAPKGSSTKAWRYVDGKGSTIVRNGTGLISINLQRLKDAGIKEIWAYEPGFWDLVCEQFCGQGHYTMQAKVVVIDNEEYKRKFETTTSEE